MNNLILADYYEEKSFINKALRLRKRNAVVIYGWHKHYHEWLGMRYTYGYEQGNASWFNYGIGHGYWNGDGSYYKW